MDLIDSIQPVCNFLEQRQRHQHSATDFYSLQNITAAWCCAVTAVKDKINTLLRDLEGKVVPSIRKRVNAGVCENLPPVLVATERWRCWVHRCTASGLWTVYGEIKWSQLAVCRMSLVKSSSSHHSLPVEPLEHPLISADNLNKSNKIVLQHKWLHYISILSLLSKAQLKNC